MNTTDNQATVSMALVTILLNYLSRIRKDPYRLCESVGITSVAFNDPDYRIGYKQFGSLWNAAEREANDPDFGLHAMKDATLNYPGGHILFNVALNCPDVEQAMLIFFRYHDLMNNVVKPKMETDASFFYITWDLFDSSLKLPRHISEALLLLYSFILSTLTQNKLELTEVRFEHKKPSDITEHRGCFNAPLKFEQPRNEIVLERKYLNIPLFWANPDLLKTLEVFADARMEKIHTGKTCSNEIIPLMNAKIAKGEKVVIYEIAETMGLSVRSLQKRLKEENTTFQTIFNNVRKTIACNYLRREDASMIDIAFLLGYSEQSAFNHAFKRWTGSTPRDYVKQKSFH